MGCGRMLILGWIFFEMKPCPHFGWVPPGAPFLSRQERGKECGLREALSAKPMIS